LDAKVERVVLNALLQREFTRPDFCAFGESNPIVLGTRRSTFASICDTFADACFLAPSANQIPSSWDKTIHLVAASRAGRYLENGYARIFAELPLQFSNEAPALI
jgi:hypothetical protein